LVAYEQEPPGVFRIVAATTVAEIDTIRLLFREYATWLGIDLSFQNFDEEVAGVPGKYAPPDGRLLLVFVGRGGNVGCLALRFRPESTQSGPSVRP
jgi:hypothetical protein